MKIVISRMFTVALASFLATNSTALQAGSLEQAQRAALSDEDSRVAFYGSRGGSNSGAVSATGGAGKTAAFKMSAAKSLSLQVTQPPDSGNGTDRSSKNKDSGSGFIKLGNTEQILTGIATVALCVAPFALKGIIAVNPMLFVGVLAAGFLLGALVIPSIDELLSKK